MSWIRIKKHDRGVLILGGMHPLIVTLFFFAGIACAAIVAWAQTRHLAGGKTELIMTLLPSIFFTLGLLGSAFRSSIEAAPGRIIMKINFFFLVLSCTEIDSSQMGGIIIRKKGRSRFTFLIVRDGVPLASMLVAGKERMEEAIKEITLATGIPAPDFESPSGNQ